jgi:hypothetical protein
VDKPADPVEPVEDIEEFLAQRACWLLIASRQAFCLFQSLSQGPFPAGPERVREGKRSLEIT